MNAEAAHIQTGQPNPTQIAKVSILEINDRMIELINCIKVDEPHSNSYYDVQTFYEVVASDRFRGFVRRHHLLKQLKREDSQGLR